MATGTVDDIIADVTQLSNDMAAALNTLNAKLDSQVTSLQNQINNLNPSGTTSGITTTPTNPTVASGSTQASVICTLAAPLLTNPTFSIVNSSGRYQISGNQLQVGAVAIDIANGATDTCTIKALGSDGVSSITATINLTVGPPGPPIVVDHNFVTAYYNTGGLSDWANAQTATLTEPWNDGHSTTFNPNTVRRTDLGIWNVGQPTSFLGLHSMDASSWSTTGDAGWVTFSSTDLGVQSSGFHAIRWASSNNANGPISAGPINQAIAIGDVIHVKVRCRDPADASASGGLWIGYRVGGAANLASLLAHITPGNMGGTAAIPSGQFLADDAHCQVVSSTLNSDGTYDCVINYTAQAAYTSGQFEIVLATQDQNTAHHIDLHGMQITKGTADYPWTPTTTAIVTNPADALVYNDPKGIFAAPQGFAVLEFQQCDHATLGTGGVSGSVAGKFLKIGSTAILAPSGPAAFKPMGAASATALGIGGFRGIVRMCITWDNTANSNAGQWTAYANGGKVATGSGLVGAAGTVAFATGITGRLRRFTGGKTTLTTAQALQMSQLHNRSYVNPGNALVPGNVTQTFYDDFDVNSLQTIPGGFTGTYAAPYNGPTALADAYAPSADATHLWKPRYHFYTHDQYGEGTDQINGELQEYLDPQGPGNYQTFTYANSCLVGLTQQTSALTTAQQANVANNPKTSGVKYPYVSWCMTTFGDNETNGGGGFNQLFGVFNMRGKLPAYTGSWPAFWLYNYNDTSEMDIEEYYGIHPTQTTTNLHTDNFANNLSGAGIEMGFDVSQDFHDWTAVWVKGTYTKYFDGEQIFTHATLTDFDNRAKFIVLNCAIQSSDTDAAGKAAMPWQTQIDRVKVFQFGS